MISGFGACGTILLTSRDRSCGACVLCPVRDMIVFCGVCAWVVDVPISGGGCGDLVVPHKEFVLI